MSRHWKETAAATLPVLLGVAALDGAGGVAAVRMRGTIDIEKSLAKAVAKKGPLEMTP
jgi:hypothetical protein